MKPRPLLFLLLLGAVLLPGCTTTPRRTGVGPEVAVMLVKVRKEKTPRRVVIALREDAAPQTVANFQELVNKH